MVQNVFVRILLEATIYFHMWKVEYLNFVW
jgi:hypothetical protein